MHKSIVIGLLLIGVSFQSFSKSSLPAISTEQRDYLRAEFGITNLEEFQANLADEAHNIWKRTSTRLVNFKPMKDEHGNPIMADTIQQWFEANNIPAQFRTEDYYKANEKGEMQVEIKKLDSRYLVFSNQESNVDFARETTEAFINSMKSYVDNDATPAKEILINELKNIHRWWIKRNADWASISRSDIKNCVHFLFFGSN